MYVSTGNVISGGPTCDMSFDFNDFPVAANCNVGLIVGWPTACVCVFV